MVGVPLFPRSGRRPRISGVSRSMAPRDAMAMSGAASGATGEPNARTSGFLNHPQRGLADKDPKRGIAAFDLPLLSGLASKYG